MIEIDKPKASCIMFPKCALCDRQAWTWVTDRGAEPAYQVALCKDHAPNGAGVYIMTALEAVREMLGIKG